MIPADYAQMNVFYSGNALPNGAQWTCGIDVSLYPGTPLALATTIRGHLQTSGVQGLTSNNQFIDAVLVKFGPDATGPSAVYANPIACTGGAESDSPAFATLVHKNTPFGGRSGRGRIYLPVPPDGAVGIGGGITPTQVGDCNTAMNLFLGKMAADDVPLVVLHRPGAPIVTPSVITSFSTMALGATQRRRLRP